MKDHKAERSISAVAALLLFAVFAVGVLTVLLGGAQSYRRLSSRDEQSYNSRTCAQYLSAKLRQAQSAGAVGVGKFGQADALELRQSVDGDTYVTRIYCCDGWLMELFTEETGDFLPGDGERILPASGLTVVQKQGLLEIRITDGSGRELLICHSLRGWEEMP